MHKDLFKASGIVFLSKSTFAIPQGFYYSEDSFNCFICREKIAVFFENKKNLLDKIIKLLFALLFLCFALFFVNIAMSSASNSKFKKINSKIYGINDNWAYRNKKGCFKISLPHRFEDSDGKIVISRKIDIKTQKGWYIAFYFATTKVHAYIDGKMIYSEDFSFPENCFLRYYNRKWNLIELDKDCCGKTLTLEIFTQNTRKKDFIIKEIQLAEKNSILLSYILSKTYLISMSATICITLIIFVLTALISKFTLVEKRSVLFILVFMIFAALWILADAQIIQFFIANRILIMFFQYFGLSISALSVFLFAGNIKDFHFEKHFSIVIILFLLYSITVLMLQFLRLIAFIDVIFITDVIIALASILITIFILLDRIIYKNKNADVTLFIIIIFTLGYIITAMLYHIFNKVIIDYVILTMVELFLIVLFFVLIINSVKSTSIGLKAKYFETLAQEDPLTGLSKRFSYSLEVNYLDSTKTSNPVYFVVIDMNNLKNINDVYGHDSGNKALKACAFGIKTVFRRDRKYRIGGDEFVIIINRKMTDERLQKLIEKFYFILEKLSKKLPFEISTALGFACYNKNEDTRLCDTFNRADKYMYANKKKFKQLYGRSKN